MNDGLETTNDGLEKGYQAEPMQAELDMIENRESQERKDLAELEARALGVKGRQSAATSMRNVARRALAQPRGVGVPCDVYVAPTQDLREAEKVLAECAEELQAIEKGILKIKARLAYIEERKKSFNEGALRAKRQLDALRRRMKK